MAFFTTAPLIRQDIHYANALIKHAHKNQKVSKKDIKKIHQILIQDAQFIKEHGFFGTALSKINGDVKACLRKLEPLTTQGKGT